MTENTAGRIAGLFRYPIKGFSPEKLETADVVPGGTITGDRAYVLENGPSGFDADDPKPLPKISFFVLMANPELAHFETHLDAGSQLLTVRRDGVLALRTSLASPDGRRTAESFFAAALAPLSRGPVRLLSAKDHSFSDVGYNCLHIINLASVRALEAALERPIDPRRFRANLYVDGFNAWSERDWMGKRLKIGQAVMEVTEETRRCAATNVNLETAARDMTLPDDLDRLYEHRNFGVYAKVLTPGSIRLDAPVELTDAPAPDPQ